MNLAKRVTLLLGGVLALSTLQVTPCRGDDILWSHLDATGALPATTGGWVVFDSRRERFLHHPGGWFFISDPIGAPGLFGYLHPPGMYSIFPDSSAWAPAVPDGPFPSRMDASAVYDSLTDRVIVFGGGRRSSSYTFTYDQPIVLHNDVWVFDTGGTAQWAELATPEPRPSPRHDASMILDTSRHRLLLFGGRDSSGALDELWELSLDGALLWHRIMSPGGPSKRSGHAAVYDPRRDRMVIACGADPSGAFLDDTWAFDPVSETWSELAPGGPAPDGPTAGAYDAAGDQMVTISTSPVSPQPIRVRTLSLATGGTWGEPSIGPTSPGYWIVDWPTPHMRVAVAMSTTPRALMVLWDAPSTIEAVGFGEAALSASLARFQPVERLVMQFTEPTWVYSPNQQIPDPWLLWPVRMNRAPYSPVRVRNTTTGFEATTLPDNSGSFLIHAPLPTPGTRHTYRIRWFDGYAERDTGDFFVEAPDSTVPPIPPIAPLAILGLTNPARDQISFVVDIRDAGPCDVSVYDVSGRRLMKETFAGPGTHSLSVRGTAGLYFVRLVHGGTTESRRVVLIQ